MKADGRRATTDPIVAEKVLADRVRELLTGRVRQERVAAGIAKPKAPELEAFASAHLIAKARGGRVTTAWLSRTEQRLRLAVEFFGANRPLDAIGENDVHRWIAWLQRRSGRRGSVGLSAAAVRHYLNALSNLYRYAEFERMVASGYNPAATVRQRLGAQRATPQALPRVDRGAATRISLDDAEQVLPFLKAMAEERRLRILTLLRAGERSVGELQTALKVGQSLLSFHLRVLKDIGVVADRRDGRSVYYTLDPNALDELEMFIREMRSSRALSR
jgi:ArsR family transcriptional regulator